MEQAKKKVKINSAHLSYILKGVLIGAIAGVVVGAFRWLIEKSLGLWKHVFQMAHQQPLYLLVIGVVLVYCVKSLFENLSKHNKWPDRIKMEAEGDVLDGNSEEETVEP